MKESLEKKFQEALKARNEHAEKGRKAREEKNEGAAEAHKQWQCLEQGKMEAYAQVLWDEFKVQYSISTGEKLSA